MPEHTLTARLSQEEIDVDVGVVALVEGPDAGREEALLEGRLTLGSGEHADVRLADRAVSRLHCELRWEDGAVRLRDLGSKNGVWIAGCRIEDAVLRPGVRVRLGTSAFEVRVARQRQRLSVWDGPDAFGPLHGASRAMHRIFAILERIAPARVPVLVTGESGTGKELVARALHDASERAGGPFVVVDGGALSRTLADSELFGHVRGAFTGALADHAGAFERADGGTIFLDEVAELPLDTQSKLLRAVQEGTVRRVGDGEERRVDVRVVAATHRDLRRRVNEGTFREDLYYRLAGVVVELPPLRERAADVPTLAARFVESFAPDDPAAREAVDAALRAAEGYRWPGNVRELRSFVRRAVLLGDASLGALPATLDGPARIRMDVPFADARREWVEAFERQYLRATLDECGGNVTEAARRAGLARSSFYELMEKLGI